MEKFKKISIALMSAVLTVWFCGILEGISVFAEESGTADMQIEVTITPDGLLEMNTEITFHIDIVGEGTTPFDYEIEYGDEITESHTTSALSYEFKHTYDAAGTYTVTALAMDDESEWGVVEFEYEVAEEAPTQCGDLLDNDGDGLEDYPYDPGCTSIDDNNEYNTPVDDPNDGSGDSGDTGDDPADDGGDDDGNDDGGLQFYQDLDSFFDDQNGTGQSGSDTSGSNTTGSNNSGSSLSGTTLGNTTNTLNQGTLGQTPDSQAQAQATLALQNATTGQSAGTGPEALIYLVFPGLALAINRFRGLE
ncbi:PKD domain-containing protein [Candidatus Peregrinibacteria bacterium]|nr:PKD domain-containing protein [Candidatus Peregrinibacteria bacterium]MBT4148569.1 PKD domain-containing protein [Candidatus Peregrinibacteria bacterium]MBT4366511.1 PKD domain-containing protein [Candidatus Peregrinibacteria bacterium]MBT4455996.1 PKD domain-containing protein [Candidatus Peregrinibacteria bacterium]